MWIFQIQDIVWFRHIIIMNIIIVHGKIIFMYDVFVHVKLIGNCKADVPNFCKTYIFLYYYFILIYIILYIKHVIIMHIIIIRGKEVFSFMDMPA